MGLLPPQLGPRQDAQLGAALNALSDLQLNNDAAAINALNAFINAVTGQSFWIGTGAAAALIAQAQDAISQINCLSRA